MILRSRVTPALLTLLLALAFPTAASALTYEVNSTADEADAAVGTAGCLTAGGKCTLRAAIEESNASTSVKDTVDFSAAFDGQLADTIAITLGELQITDEVTIDGDNGVPCTTAAAIAGPCVGVSGSVGLDVISEDVEIKGLAVTGATIGIGVFSKSTGFTATNNWLGVKLDGSAGANSTGIFIGPGSDFASIGGTAAADRNVFANNSSEGLDIEGASDAVVRGDFFGVAPDGVTQAANGKDIEITDSTVEGGFAASGNEVGRTIEGEALTSTACDGGCNVISGALGSGIDLNGNLIQGEEPASGPTTVHGNFVGLNSTGTGVLTNGTFAILAGGANDAQIGGIAGGETNYIAGSEYGIYNENGESFEARSNKIGFDAAGADALPPSVAGIFVFSLGATEPATIDENDIRMTGGIGIEHRFLGATITDNFIEGGLTGIKTFASTEPAGSLIEGNVLEGPTGNGILVENDGNEIVGNFVFNSGLAGIRIEDGGSLIPATGNQVGGDTEASENTIEGSGGDAIEIVDESGSVEPSQNEVARNNGALNGDLFIDLVGTANDGIQPPEIMNAAEPGASGTAEPGAVVRVFRKASVEAGELASFLGEAVADGSGAWKVTYGSPIPGGTIVAATQTNTKGGTSELETAPTTTVIVDSGCELKGNCPKPEDKGKGGDKDKTPPETKIVKGPPRKTHKRTVKFKFVSSEAGSTFQCKLDRKPFKRCSSPKKYKRLKPGKHVFKVRAIDAAGNVDPTPAKRKFTVLR